MKNSKRNCVEPIYRTSTGKRVRIVNWDVPHWPELAKVIVIKNVRWEMWDKTKLTLEK